VGFVVGKVALGQTFLRVGRLSSVSIVPPVLQTQPIFQATFNRRTNRTILQRLKQKCSDDAFFFSEIGQQEEVYVEHMDVAVA
jgi:hypothetical protein